ncbi:MAG: hypothetical protein ACKODH_09445 [Limisphaerales bacterium]
MRSIFLLSLLAFAAFAAEPPKFRTDADGPVKAEDKRSNPRNRKPTDKPDWFQLVPGEFPPDGSAHAVSGELMQMDHLERRFQIRVARNDSQERGIWDLPLDATMLPYGSIWQHGAPAALQDIPLGTHLRGLFYLAAPDDKTPLPDTAYRRKTPEWEFRRCFRIEDEFTFHSRQQQLWRIDTVNLGTNKLTATLLANGQPVGDGKPKSFDLLASTRVFQGDRLADLKALQPGQTVLFNLTWVTLYGPGRITDLWVDEAARARATAHQLERHRQHIRERGLAGFVSAVDDDAQIVTITFFGGVDPKLFTEIRNVDTNKVGWPLAKEAENPGAPTGTIAVARESLLTYDPVNDRKGGNIVDIKTIPTEPGSAGLQIKVKCDLLLEGFRPKRVVRFYPATWKVIALPHEEQSYGRD